MATSADANNPLLRIATLLDDLKHDDISMRVNSMKHLREITVALGVERTREELLPFLGDTVMDDEDEVLLEAAGQFGELVNEVGGVEHIPSLLKVLEELAAVDEPTVRSKAVESMYKLVPQMKKEAVGASFVPIIRKLAKKDWFTARSAACSLFAAAYPYVNDETKAELRGLFGQLCQDDTPTVRKAAAENMGKLAALVEQKTVVEEFYPLFDKLVDDSQDSVKLLAVTNIIEFAKIESKPEEKREMLTRIFKLAEDPAWRVKWTIANSFFDITKIAVESAGSSDIIPQFVRLYVRLLVDEEPEVKAAAVKRLTDIGAKYSESKEHPNVFAENVIPVLAEVVSDSSDFVRIEVGSVVLGMAPVVGKDKTIEYIVPLCLRLLEDPQMQVRLNFISSLDSLKGVIDIDQISPALLDSVEVLAKNNQWRTRHAIIEHIPLIARHLGMKTFDDKLAEFCMKWLRDEVYSIRKAATENIQKLTKLFGEEWARKRVFVQIENLCAESSYLFRLQALRAVESLSTVVSADALNTELLPFVLKLAADKTPNIKFNVAKCLESIGDRLEGGVVKNDVKPALEPLLKDPDDDVQYFAARAMKCLGL